MVRTTEQNRRTAARLSSTGADLARYSGTWTALSYDMALRSFVADDGLIWRVWRVESSDDHIVASHPGRARSWLAFQNALGTQRRRLFNVPDDWERLPDDQLELLRLSAQPVKGLRWPGTSKPASTDERGSPEPD
jgi:hypothetical protein